MLLESLCCRETKRFMILQFNHGNRDIDNYYFCAE